jgi:pimeloyl-ACP methyl ester carboxylesterase
MMRQDATLLAGLVVCLLLAGAAFGAGQDANKPKELWNGYEILKFNVAGRGALLVVPKQPAEGKPWIWRTEFFGAFPQADVALLGKGVYVAQIDVHNMFGSPSCLDIMDQFYAHLRKEYGLSAKPVLEGFSRGGMAAMTWPVRNPEKVACIYLDAPVLDFKSWPGGGGRSRLSGRDWRDVLSSYKMTEAEARAYKLNPVDNLEPLAKAKISILSVIGDKEDWVVPIEENTLKAEQRYKKLGGDITVIQKPHCGHHPHSLEDPTPIVDFVMKHVTAKPAEEKKPDQDKPSKDKP